MRVSRIFRLVDHCLVLERGTRPGELVGLLSNVLAAKGETAPPWSVEFRLSEGENARVARLAIEPFLSVEEYHRSMAQPLPFSDIETVRDLKFTEQLPSEFPVTPTDPARFWLFRDAIYATERSAATQEVEEVVLRIKAMQYKEADSIRRLREQVANFEAVEKLLSEPGVRRALPDDVKLLVWSRDGGICVRCGAASDLHFDHIIPFSRGGGDQAENIQLLCRACNLAKSARLT